MTDQELLTAYVREKSQDAFRTLVERYIHLVYAAAVRKTSDPAMAEDITQAVFIVLARRAGKVHNGRYLPAWLLQVTRHCAADARRSAQRRRIHEREAAMNAQTMTGSGPDVPEEEVSRQLDEVMAGLPAPDRTAVLLRFYQGQTFAEVGSSLGLSEDAAKKRLARALEKLRKAFGRRGVTFSAALLTGAVSRQATAAPPTLLPKTCTVALTPAPVAGTAAGIAKGAMTIMTWNTAKTAAVVAAGILLACGSGAAIVQALGHAPTAPLHPVAVTPVLAVAAPVPAVMPPQSTTPGLTVRDTTGRPLSNAYVQWSNARNNAMLTTDAQGHCDLTKAELSSHQLTIYSQRSRRMAIVTLPPNYTPDMPIEAICDCYDAHAEGMILDDNGDPAPAASLNLFVATTDGQLFHYADKSDENGYFYTQIPAKEGLTCWASPSEDPKDAAATAHVALGDRYQAELPDVRLGAGGKTAAPKTKRIHYGGTVVDEAGRGIPRVELEMTFDKQHMLYPAGNLLTDADGKFSRFLPPDATNVYIRLTAKDYIGYQFGKLNTPVSVDALKAGTALIIMKRGVPLTGTVVDAATGKPVVNALVMAATSYSSGMGEIIEDFTSPRTDFAGQFTATGLPLGPRDVRIIVDGYAPQLVRTVVKAEMAPLEIKLQPGLTYSGQVVDAVGKPVADVRVHAQDWAAHPLERIPLPRHAVTDAAGRFTLSDLPREGSIELFLSKSKFAPTSASWKATGENPATLTLLPTPMVTGTVVDDATGQPVTDFTAYPALYWGSEPSTLDFNKPKTVHNGTGKFSVAITNFINRSGASSPLAVRIVAEGYMPAFSPPVPFDGKPHPVTIKLHAAPALTGSLHDAFGKPVGAAKVMVIGPKNATMVRGIAMDEQLAGAPKDSVKTEDDGAFSLPASELPTQLLALHPDGYAILSLTKAGDDARMTLTPWATVEGTILHDGKPENGVPLRLEPAKGDDPHISFELIATTDLHGHFRFEHVPNLELRLLRHGLFMPIPLAEKIHPEPGKLITIPLPASALAHTDTPPATRTSHTGD